PAEPRNEAAQPAARPAREAQRPPPERQAAAAEKAETPRQEAKRDIPAYLVKPGDTLRSIAQQHQPEGASLEQMLVAIYRSNRSAFQGGNINRLMAGKLLSLPDDDAVKSVPPAEAHKRVVANSADFAGYRRKLAADVQAAPARDTGSSRQSGGRIAPKVEESAAASQPKDQLKVSRTGTDSAETRQANGQPLSPDRLKALEEDRLAKDKALKDANERLAELEKNIRQLQGLIDLKSRSLAEAQRTGAAPQAAPQTPTPVPQAAAPKPAPAPVPAAEPLRKVEAPAPSEQPEAAGGLLDDPAILAGGGGILALLLGWAGLVAYRRRKGAQQAAPAEVPAALVEDVQAVHGNGGESIDTATAAPAIQADFSQAGLGSIDADEGVDPVAEADVYIAYGRDAQAEEILLDALKTDPARPAVLLKLLEIYAHRGNVEPFDKFAGELHAITGGQGPDWEAGAALGRKLSPDNPRYREDGAAAAAAAAEKVALAEEGIDFHLTGVKLPETSNSSEIYGQPSRVVPPVAAAAVAAAEPEFRAPPATAAIQEEAAPAFEISGLDFDLDLPDDEPAAAPLVPEEAPKKAAIDEAAAVAETGGLDFELDFALPEAGSHAEEVQLDDTVVAPELSRAMQSDSAGNAWDEAGALDMEFDQDADEMHTEFAGGSSKAVDVDLAATRLEALPESHPTEADADDMEKTRIESNFLDFDFDPGEAATPAAAQAASAPDVDLSGIDLDLDFDIPAGEAAPAHEDGPAGGIDGEEPIVEFVPDPAQDPFAEFAPKHEDDEVPALPAEPEIDPAVLQEVATKLELARAYEEMGDREGARELLDEAIRDGSIAQQDEA
ncbi:MAG: hypothetical protein HGA47_12005, partial [Zoogloea sp.]|nr:hypothetical protein [Zoogloea sp.]